MSQYTHTLQNTYNSPEAFFPTYVRGLGTNVKKVENICLILWKRTEQVPKRGPLPSRGVTRAILASWYHVPKCPVISCTAVSTLNNCNVCEL